MKYLITLMMSILLFPLIAVAGVNGWPCCGVEYRGNGLYRIGIEAWPDRGESSLSEQFDFPGALAPNQKIQSISGTAAFRKASGSCAPQHLSAIHIDGLVFPLNQKLPFGIASSAETVFFNWFFPEGIPYGAGNVAIRMTTIDANCYPTTFEIQGTIYTIP